MTIINCTANCIHQNNGKCSFDHVDTATCTSDQDCAFFQEKGKKENLSFSSKKS
ncbi:hydroxymyristoyl-ACP dehydratase [Garciella nitratireducens]|uniref:hydroxymyristoyl-ACP dehydratase n=1 Tax=Garciella nitratireducens TaxID=218205 RepID=UPI000DEBAB7A|nr:hydroxymyristoyl-ACP dehydratase [Garciella nitratireducens]